MKIFKKCADGGKKSGVTGYFLIELKLLFSVVVLKFESNTRENYHSHAFNALTWWVKGKAIEEFVDAKSIEWTPSIIPKWTPISNMHRYSVTETSWAISFRGPWVDTWKEYNPNTKQYLTLTHGRNLLDIKA